MKLKLHSLLIIFGGSTLPFAVIFSYIDLKASLFYFGGVLLGITITLILVNLSQPKPQK